MAYEIQQASVIKVNDQFWRGMLGMEVVPDEETTTIDILGERVCADIRLNGAWEGIVETWTSLPLVQEAAGAMLGMDPAEVVGDDVLDAAREIANIIAGTIKSALPQPCNLSLPTAEIRSFPVSLEPRTSQALAMSFRHTSGQFVVRLLES